MRIIQVITELTPAGAERVVANLSIELKSRGYDVAVLSLMPLPFNITILKELADSNIPVKSLNLTKKSLWRIFKFPKLLKELDKFMSNNNSRNDELIIHSHLMHPNLICRLLKLTGCRFRLINTIHTSEKRRYQKLNFLMDRVTLGFCDNLTAVSKASAEFHASKIKTPLQRIHVIHNGIKETIKPDTDFIYKLKEEWKFENCTKIIGSVGRLDYAKGYDIFLRKISDISRIIPTNEKWGVIIIGDGTDRESIKKTMEYLPKNIDVILPGYREDAVESIYAFDLFVMPSRFEGFGLTLIEAMSTGVPILSSFADSLPDLIKPYSNGTTVNFKNTDELTSAVAKYINRPFIQWQNRYTVKKMTDRYVELYRRQGD